MSRRAAAGWANGRWPALPGTQLSLFDPACVCHICGKVAYDVVRTTGTGREDAQYRICGPNCLTQLHAEIRMEEVF